IWAARLTDRPAGTPANDPSLKLSNQERFFGVEALAITDSSGSCQLHYESGLTPSNIHVYIPGGLGATASLYHLKKTDLAVSETILPDVSLPLDAQVALIAEAPEKVPDQFLAGEAEGKETASSSLTAAIGFERPGPWPSAIPPLNGNKDNPWTLITKTDWISS